MQQSIQTATTGQRVSPTEADVLQQFATSAMTGSLSQMAPIVEKDLMTAKAMSLASHDILGAHAREIQHLREKLEIAEAAHKSATARSAARERQHVQQIVTMQQSIQTANDLAAEKTPWATIVPPDLTRYSGNSGDVPPQGGGSNPPHAGGSGSSGGAGGSGGGGFPNHIDFEHLTNQQKIILDHRKAALDEISARANAFQPLRFVRV
jgi:hypothetical protein